MWIIYVGIGLLIVTVIVAAIVVTPAVSPATLLDDNNLRLWLYNNTRLLLRIVLWVVLRLHNDLWLLLRHAYRWATPWQRHEPMSPLASVSVALSIFGMVGLLLLPGARLPGVVEIAVPALCLLGGLVCGILSRRERAGLLGAIASGGGLMILLLVTA